jgi:hypothetical protein
MICGHVSVSDAAYRTDDQEPSAIVSIRVHCWTSNLHAGPGCGATAACELGPSLKVNSTGPRRPQNPRLGRSIGRYSSPRDLLTNWASGFSRPSIGVYTVGADDDKAQNHRAPTLPRLPRAQMGEIPPLPIRVGQRPKSPGRTIPPGHGLMGTPRRRPQRCYTLRTAPSRRSQRRWSKNWSIVDLRDPPRRRAITTAPVGGQAPGLSIVDSTQGARPKRSRSDLLT